MGSKLQKISLHKILSMIKYKAEWYGKTTIQINRFYPSSQLCNNCGYKNEKLELKDRDWICPKCGTHHHRDVNAAINILNEALRLYGEEK